MFKTLSMIIYRLPLKLSNVSNFLPNDFETLSTNSVATMNASISSLCTRLYERFGLKQTAWFDGNVHGVVVQINA